MSEDAVLVVTRKTGRNHQEKRVIQQQREKKLSVLIVTICLS